MRVRTYEIGDTQQIVKLFYDTVTLEDAIAKYRPVDFDGTLVKTARGLGICLGDKTITRPISQRFSRGRTQNHETGLTETEGFKPVYCG